MRILISLIFILSSLSCFSQSDTEIYNWVNNPYIGQESAFYVIDGETAWAYADGDDGVSCEFFEIYEPEVTDIKYANDKMKSMTIDYTVNRSCWPETWVCQGEFTFKEGAREVDRYDYKYDCKFID